MCKGSTQNNKKIQVRVQNKGAKETEDNLLRIEKVVKK
jgi:hypothetical protein